MKRVSDLAIVIVSANSARWLRPCLSSVFAAAGDIALDVVVVASGCTDDTVDVVQREFPQARTVTCENHGFAYANNRALETIDASWTLFLNPDTQIREGSLSDLLGLLRARPAVGAVGVRQVTPNGDVFPTIRRFPNAARSFFEALGSERFPIRARWLGERELDLAAYDRDIECDWTTGAFLLVRTAALQEVGLMDERFFLYCEETDLCLRVKRAGWEIRHVPAMTILHHANKAGWNPQLEAQAAYARRQYVEKHFAYPHRVAAIGALALGFGIRSLVVRPSLRRRSARASLLTLLGLRPPPFAKLSAH